MCRGAARATPLRLGGPPPPSVLCELEGEMELGRCFREERSNAGEGGKARERATRRCRKGEIRVRGCFEGTWYATVLGVALTPRV